MRKSTSFTTAALLTFAAVATQAGTAGATLGQHPAVIVKARAQTIDPNLFIVQPPASVSWTRPHTNGEHPALLVARQASAIDSNAFQVQPPASVTWTLQSASDTAALVAARETIRR